MERTVLLRDKFGLCFLKKNAFLEENQLLTNYLLIYVYVQKHTYENENYLVLERTYSKKSSLFENLKFPNFKKFIFHANSPCKLQ